MRASMLGLFVVLAGCESGLGRSIDVKVPAEIRQSYSPTSPGAVVADVGGEATPFLVLCGESLPEPLELSQDLGFGCLGSRNGTEETVRVWIQPLDVPADADAGVRCASSREFYGATALTYPDGGSMIAAAPDAGWPQGSGQGTWRRDISPCGGVLNVSVTLAR